MESVRYMVYKNLDINITRLERNEGIRRLYEGAKLFSENLKFKFPQIEIVAVLWLSRCAIEILIPDKQKDTLPEQIARAFQCRVTKPKLIIPEKPDKI